MDVTHTPLRQDSWGHLTTVIDCYDREIVGYELTLRGRAQEAERTLETACLACFGRPRPAATPVHRSDSGLIFQSRRVRRAFRAYRWTQEFIAQCTPQQNGLIKGFFRNLKE